jgi:hypothetical protein
MIRKVADEVVFGRQLLHSAAFPRNSGACPQRVALALPVLDTWCKTNSNGWHWLSQCLVHGRVCCRVSVEQLLHDGS